MFSPIFVSLGFLLRIVGRLCMYVCMYMYAQCKIVLLQYCTVLKFGFAYRHNIILLLHIKTIFLQHEREKCLHVE